jgi:hypothetical protein
MKRLEIGKKLSTFAGKEVTDSQKDGDDKVISVKDLLVQYVGQLFDEQNKEKVLRAYMLAQKIYNCDSDFMDVEDAEFKLIVEATDKPKMGHTPMILGPLYIALKEAEKRAEKKREKAKK